jgi:hypothetical protein
MRIEPEKITMNILQLSPVKRSIVKKRLRVALNNDYLAEITGVAPHETQSNAERSRQVIENS